jgi:hypothetical protein
MVVGGMTQIPFEAKPFAHSDISNVNANFACTRLMEIHVYERSHTYAQRMCTREVVRAHSAPSSLVMLLCLLVGVDGFVPPRPVPGSPRAINMQAQLARASTRAYVQY